MSDEEPMWTMLFRLIAFGYGLLGAAILVGLWTHNLWPALGIASVTGALIWTGLIVDRQPRAVSEGTPNKDAPDGK